MKGLVKFAPGPGNMEIREVAEPVIEPGLVKIKIKEAGICGSDLHIYHSDIAIPVRPPVVIGHEFSGIVTEVGAGVENIVPGDRVVSETAFSYCGECVFCTQGYYNLCTERRTLGYWYNGIFTNYTVVPAGRIHPIPSGMSFTSAAMIEPLACVIHAVYDLTKIIPGDVVLVSGPGSIGLMAVQVAKAHGATVVAAGTGIDSARLELARKLGADYSVDVQQEDLAALASKITRGYGFDVVLECSGSEKGIDTALHLIKKQGYFTQIGLPGKKITFDIEKICFKEIHFTGSLGSRGPNWDIALKLVDSGMVKLEPLCSHKFSILDWEKAFALFENKEGVKIFLLPAE